MDKQEVLKTIIAAITEVENNPAKYIDNYIICEALYQARDYIMMGDNMKTEELIALGKEAKELLAKFPYLNAPERKYHERVALIGKLAENGGVTMRCDREEIERLQAEIKTEVENMRKH